MKGNATNSWHRVLNILLKLKVKANIFASIRSSESGADNIPRYTFRETDNGLYKEAHPRSGNKISQGENESISRRKWYANVWVETIRSEALKETMTIPITTSCFHTIKESGRRMLSLIRLGSHRLHAYEVQNVWIGI